MKFGYLIILRSATLHQKHLSVFILNNWLYIMGINFVLTCFLLVFLSIVNLFGLLQFVQILWNRKCFQNKGLERIQDLEPPPAHGTSFKDLWVMVLLKSAWRFLKKIKIKTVSFKTYSWPVDQQPKQLCITETIVKHIFIPHWRRLSQSNKEIVELKGAANISEEKSKNLNYHQITIFKAIQNSVPNGQAVVLHWT